jgi:hypothetical protein
MKITIFLIATFFAIFAHANIIAEGKCAFTVASRSSLHDVGNYIEHEMHGAHKPFVRVVQTKNGWYAITVGDVPIDEFEHIKQRLLSMGVVPPDSYCSQGDAYVRVVLPNEFQGMNNANQSTTTSKNSKSGNCAQQSFSGWLIPMVACGNASNYLKCINDLQESLCNIR